MQVIISPKIAKNLNPEVVHLAITTPEQKTK